MKTPPQDKDPISNAMQWLIRLQSPELTKLEEKHFFAWLEASAENQLAYIEAELFFQRLDVVQAISASSDEQIIKSTFIQNNRRWYPKALVASIVLLVSIILSQFWGVWELETYRSVIGEQRRVVLADGSQLMLNTNSQIRVKKMTVDEARVVYLDKGEVFFNVISDKGRPFLVQAKRGAVRVLGTQFTARTVENDMWITVLEGKVAIADSTADKMGTQGLRNATLLADQQLSIAQAVKGLAPKTVDAKALTSWQHGKLVYNGVSFEDIVKDLSRYFQGELILGEDSLKAIKMVAVLEITDKASTVTALETAFNVVAVQRSKNVTVLYSSE